VAYIDGSAGVEIRHVNRPMDSEIKDALMSPPGAMAVLSLNPDRMVAFAAQTATAAWIVPADHILIRHQGRNGDELEQPVALAFERIPPFGYNEVDNSADALRLEAQAFGASLREIAGRVRALHSFRMAFQYRLREIKSFGAQDDGDVPLSVSDPSAYAANCKTVRTMAPDVQRALARLDVQLAELQGAGGVSHPLGLAPAQQPRFLREVRWALTAGQRAVAAVDLVPNEFTRGHFAAAVARLGAIDPGKYRNTYG
jgi:hypothetical protein